MYSRNKLMDILKLVSKDSFKKAVNNHDGNKYRKGFDCYTHFVAMVYAQITGLKSLREIEMGLKNNGQSLYHLGIHKVSKSSLSDANRKGNPEVFRDLCQAILNHTLLPRQHKRSFRETLEILDSTPIQLRSRFYDSWTHPHKTRHLQGVKLHLAFDLAREQISKFHISPANVNDINVARTWGIETGQCYVFDKGYYDYNWWWKLEQSGAYFVTRPKSNINLAVMGSLPIEDTDGIILSDELVKFGNKRQRGGRKNHYQNPLRRVVVRLDKTDKTLILITNIMEISALDIAQAYKERWSIENFFKTIKQNLKIKKFVGHSQNAVLIQIFIAMIVQMLLIQYCKKSGKKANLHEQITILRAGSLLSPIENYYNQRRRLRKLQQENSNQYSFNWE